ncbi:MAG: tetratricopeptide repeat protein [Planctomycetales bacterium]|nr:tetratricopeptide repeat protein [Planctomycetales bacterium]
MSQEFSFKLDFDDFDRSLLGNPTPAVGSDEFKSKITDFFARQFIGFGGKARVVIDDSSRVIEVLWTKNSNWKDPKQKALDMLNAGQITQSLPILTTLYHKDPSDVDTLYRLGLAYSELGQYQQATELLEKAVEIAPNHVHALVGLGVAEVAMDNLLIAEESLRKALQLEPSNRWALRNLAGALMKQERYDESLLMIHQCLAVAPDDIAMMIAYGDCLTELGRSDESQVHYRIAIKTGGPEHLVDLAKARLSKKSEQALRSTGDIRPDVVQYMKDAIKQFESMEVTQIQNLALELTLLGNKGLNINDPAKKHQIKTWIGEYTGLQLISIMYAAFQQFAPDTDIGIDLRKEYCIALGE